MRSLAIPHRKQQQASDCLAACAAMTLAFLHREFDYGELLLLLRVTESGTRRSEIRNLERLGCSVSYFEGNWPTLTRFIDGGLPVIAFVSTGGLTYWDETVQHALVVAGYSENEVYVHDPAFDAPLTVSRDEFEIAWQECDYFCAVIRP